MEKIPKRVYTKEFKEQSAKLVVEGGAGLTETARRLSISAKTLANWVAAARHGERTVGNDKRRPVTELEAEVSRLKCALAEMKLERDLLKKATAYFAKESR